MSENVTSIDEYRPHHATQVKCASCEHDWTAVFPATIKQLECPKCNYMTPAKQRGSTAMKFRKKPVEIEAVQWNGGNVDEVADFMGRSTVVTIEGKFSIPTLEGDMLASQGDWIIRGVKGEFYPCKPDIFAATYEPVSDP